jgi:hypothetical protein
MRYTINRIHIKRRWNFFKLILKRFNWCSLYEIDILTYCGDEVGGACGANAGEGASVKVIGMKARRKETTR